MDNSNDLINQSVREIQASTKTLPTEAGQANAISREQKQDAINQVFALFRINYHNQYHAAFGDTAVLNQAKRLWFESLQHFLPEQLLLAAKQIIEQSEYLPSLHTMLEACEDNLQSIDLPPVRQAYMEACNAPLPKISYSWSHPAVYFAGQETGWYLLANESEKQSYDVFAKNYRKQIRLVLAGAKLEIDAPKQITQNSGRALSKEEKQAEINKIKAQFN